MDISTVAPASQTTAAASSTAFSSLTNNIDTFLTLLTTQLRNQDPLEPLDTEKFTSQLVQFASVEQSIKTNSHLEALIALQGAQDRQAAISFVGQDVTLASDKTTLKNGAANWTYSLPSDASAVSLKVFNAAGVEVASGPGALSAGAHAFEWNGRTAQGATAPDGVYRLEVSAQGPDGAKIDATIETTLRIGAANFGDGAPTLETAAGTVALADIRRLAAQGE